MICTTCHQADTVPGTTTVTLERDGTTVVTKGVPALICPNCGEDYLSDEVSARVLEIACEAARTGASLDVRQYAAA